MINFEGKSVLITGASVGIGRAAAIQFARFGAKLAMVDINYEKLKSVKEEIKEFTDDVLICKCDVSREEEVNNAVENAVKQFGRIDILVNNAALWRSCHPFEEIPISEWQSYINVNIRGVVYFSKAVLPQMIENNYGRIINVASVAGVYGNANMTCYSATKGAVISLTKALAKEVTAKGVLVNSVSPGSVSDSSDSDINSYTESEMSFMGRTGTDKENANLICFLASDAASYISGQNIQIDGCRKKQ